MKKFKHSINGKLKEKPPQIKDKPLKSLSKGEFNELKNMGYLWEFYPDAPENWEEIE